MRVSLFLYCRKIRRFCGQKGLRPAACSRPAAAALLPGRACHTAQNNSMRIIQNLVMTFSPVWGTMLYKVPIISQEEPNFEEAL